MGKLTTTDVLFYDMVGKKKIKIELSRSSKVRVQFRYGRGCSIVTQIQSVMHRLRTLEADSTLESPHEGNWPNYKLGSLLLGSQHSWCEIALILV